MSDQDLPIIRYEIRIIRRCPYCGNRNIDKLSYRFRNHKAVLPNFDIKDYTMVYFLCNLCINYWIEIQGLSEKEMNIEEIKEGIEDSIEDLGDVF